MKKTTIALGIVVLIPALFFANVLLRPITFSETVDFDENLPSVTLNDYTFHAETRGEPENPVVIALHGGPGGDYRNLLPIEPLSDDYFLVFYDQRMTGLSSREFDGVIDLQSYFDDLDAIVDHYGDGRKVILLGHSWGAMMASGYVGMHPEKVDRIVMIEPGILRPDLSEQFTDAQSGPPRSAYPGMAKIWLNSWRVDISRDQYAREDYILSNVYPLMPGNGVHCGDVIPANFEGWRASRKILDENVIAYAHDPALFARLDFITDAHKFDGKVLLIGTTCNTNYGAEYQQQHLPFYQDARLAVIEDSGHFIFYDQPKASLELIRAFLKE